MMPTHGKNARGFSLVELLTALTILIIETDIDPANKNHVEWVRYELIDTTLYRGVVSPKAGTDPEGLTAGVLVPYVQNVMNNPSAAQLAAIQATYPSLFPGGNPVPIFQYFCETTPQPVDCTSLAASTHDPTHVVSVVVTLIVQAPTADMTTGRLQVVQLKGEGRRLNPDY